MNPRWWLLLGFAGLLGWALTAQRSNVEAVEVGKDTLHLLVKGKEADGLAGDFILRNNRVHAVISGAQPLRRANMRTENKFVTQGCLYDLDLRGEDNDQITAFRPGDFGGEVSWVKAVPNPSGGAAIEAVRTAPRGDGLYTRHEYRLEPDWQHILVTSTYRNESKGPKTVHPAPQWRGFEDSREWDVSGIHIGESIDPADKRAYAWTALPAGTRLDAEAILQPGEERSFQVALVVASSPLAAYGIAASLTGATGTGATGTGATGTGGTGEVSGSVLDAGGAAATRATLLVPVAGVTLPGYPDSHGRFAFRLPAGGYSLSLEDLGRESVRRAVSVTAGATASLDLAVSKASAVSVEIRDEGGNFSPGKVQFIGTDGTPTPNLGPGIRVHGSDHQYQTHDGRFLQQVPPGHYLLRFTHGPEYELAERRIEVKPGETTAVSAALHRTVDTRGWVSTDFHSHSTESGDNYCATDDRIINLAAEQLEFAPTTEHNRIFDWAPHIARLGLEGG